MKNKNFYTEGFKLALDNSFRLKKIADLSFAEGEYGIACSLNVLAAEEAVKASFILIKHHNPDAEIDNFEAIFTKHIIKHNHLKGIALIREIQFKRDKKLLEEFDKLFLVPDNIEEKVLSNFSPYFEIKERVKQFEETNISYKEIELWLDRANNDKNNGFYVDLKNGKWTTPNSFTKERYLLQSKYTEVILDYIKHMENMLLYVKNNKDKL